MNSYLQISTLAGKIEAMISAIARSVDSLPEASTETVSKSQKDESSTNDIRRAAAKCFQMGLWDGAIIGYLELRRRGESIEDTGPKIAACVLSSNTVLSESDQNILNLLIQELQSAGHQAAADDIRCQIAAWHMQNQPKKPWWKFW